MQGFDGQKIRWHARRYTIEDLARLWKSYLASTGFAMDEKLDVTLNDAPL